MDFFEDYIWEDGIPLGVNKGKGKFKILSDPYRKRFSVEEYKDASFRSVIYDSNLFDFRDLNPVKQAAWSKEALVETSSLVRDEFDRVILKEDYSFEGEFCREAKAFSPQGVYLSLQKMYYTKAGDRFNAVVLFDLFNKPVFCKEYAINEEGQFTELLREYRNTLEIQEFINQ